jgi:hypothetical protein
VERPLNLPGGNLRIDGRVDVARIDTGTGHDTSVDMNVGVAVGITPQIELGLSSHRPGAINDGIGNWGPTFFGQGGAVPLHLSPGGTEFQSLELYGRFAAIQNDDFDLSIDIGTMIPIQDRLPWVMFAGVPIRARLSSRFALDAAAEISIAFYDDADGDGTNPELSLHLPIAGVLNLGPQVYLAGRSGIFVPDADLTYFTIPFTLELGFTVGADRPFFDVYGSFGFPLLFQPGADDAVVSDLWVMTVGINGFVGR